MIAALGLAAALFSPAAMARIVDVSGAVITPDGSRIGYVVSRNDMEHNTSRDELHVYDLRTRRDATLPFAHSSYSNLTWSPDGTRLAYIADDKGSGAGQLFTSDSNGEHRITHGSSGVLDAAWRPDGKAFAFIRRDAAPAKHGAAAFEDGFEVTDNAYLSTKAAMPAHLWTVASNGVERRVTSGTWSVRDAPLSWSMDGRYVLYEHAPNAIYGVRDRDFAERVDVQTGARSAVTARATLENDALLSSDGRHVAYTYPRDGDPANESEVYVTDGRGDGSDVSRTLDRHVELFAWMPGSHALLLRVYDRTRVRLVEEPLGGSARALPLGDVVDASIESAQCASNAGAIVFSGTTAHRPSELYYLAPGAASPVRLTDYNREVAALALGRLEQVHWQNGKFTEYGVLTFPPRYDPHKRYPLVLRIHGGPTETSLAAFDPFYQLAAARGYLVFAPNYRGSSDDGNDFEHAIYDDASIGPGTDIIAGIRAIERMGIADPSRIGVSGWSYGGQLTTWMIGHYHIWKAAVTGAGVNDLLVDYAIADDIDDDRHAFSGPPYVGKNLELWRKHSPITYVTQIKTPTLILCNVYDVRVPIVESYELYHALRDRGVPVRFFAYPTTGHLPQGPVRLADAYRRWLDWFDSYLQPRSAR